MAAAVAALLRQFAAASSALAAEFYDGEREAAGPRSRFTVPIAEPPELEQVAATVSWATRRLRSGRDVERFDVLDLADLDRTDQAIDLDALVETPSRERLPGSVGDPQAALDKMIGATQKLMADAGRETIARAVTDDRDARGWARVPTGATTCAFCMMMCTRGAKYKDANTAGRNANERFVGAGEFKFHDRCDCIVVPVFFGQDYEPPDLVKQWERLYRQSTKGVYGSKAKQRAFRRAVAAAQPSSTSTTRSATRETVTSTASK